MVNTVNPELIALIRAMKRKSHECGVRLWRDLADRLSRSRRRKTVNVSRLNRCTKEQETVAVPGKVLGAGRMDHPINVAAFAFSELARLKVLKAKGKCYSIHTLMEKNPNGTDVRIIG